MKTFLPSWRSTLMSGSIVGAFAAGFWLRPIPPSPTLPTVVTRPLSESSVPNPSAPPVARNVASWTQLESEDYRTFVTNLRRFGCPQSTVADIVLADLLAAGHLDIESRNQFWSHLASALPDRGHAERVVHAANQLLPDMHLALVDAVRTAPTSPPTSPAAFSSAEPAATTAGLSGAQDLFESAAKQVNGPTNLATFRVLRHYRGLQLNTEEASTLDQLEQASTSSRTGPDSGDTTSQHQEAIRHLLGEDRFQEYVRMQDSRYVQLQDFLDDRMLDPGQITAVYESLKNSQGLGDAGATASELHQRFGAETAASWTQSSEASRPGYEGEVAAAQAPASPGEAPSSSPDSTPSTTVPESPARPW